MPDIISEPSPGALEAAEALRREPLHPRGHYYQVAITLDRAVAEERERCIKVCKDRSAWAEAKIESDADLWGNYSNACDDCAELIGEQP